MAKRALHSATYRAVPPLLRAMREEAGLTTRALAAKVSRPQSWVSKCENAERRVDVTEFCLWFEACGRAPADRQRAYLRRRGQPAQGGQTGDVR